MGKKTDVVPTPPNAKRVVEAFRDVGYSFVSAVADLIDNSIAANATRVDIQLHWDGPDTWLRIADNGTGMDSDTINEALRFGSERSYRPDDLGKFGLGLKTASLSQCREFTVATRTSEKIARLEVRRFDLDRILSVNRWEVENLAADERSDELIEPLSEHPGTVVLWRKLDRILTYKVPRGEVAHRALWDMAEQLEQHLGMVFHRFLEGDLHGSRRRTLEITINGNRVEPWNPFAPEEESTQQLQIRDLNVAAHGVAGVVIFEPWVLPARANFSSEEEWNRMSGPEKWNLQQGFYIYRANRMIQSGGWCRLRAPDEHTKLARVALDFFPELDAAFQINIAKMRVTLPSTLRRQLKQPVEDLIRVAKKAYKPTKGGTQKPEGEPKPPGKPTPGPVRPAPKPGQEDPSQAPWPPPPLPGLRPAGALKAAAEATGDSEALDRIREKVLEESPEVAVVIGW